MTQSSVNTDAGGWSGADAWLADFEVLLERQAALYAELDALSQRQSRLVAAVDPEPVLAVLGERPAVIDRIQASAPALARMGARWVDTAAHVREAQRVRINGRLESIDRLTGEIARRDRADHERLRERRDAVADELAAVAASRRAVAAYGPGAASGPRYKDTEG